MKPLLPFYLLIAVALGGCVPVPITNPDWVYAPNPDDAEALKEEGHFCVLNTVAIVAGRDIGDVGVRISFSSADPGNPNARRLLWMRFDRSEQTGPEAKSGSSSASQGVPRTTPASGISVDPGRIQLEEGGRTHTARMVKFSSHKSAETGVRSHTAELAFPAFGADSEGLRLVFQPDAIKIDGQSAPFSPIRFKRTTQTVIWLAPCIPS